MTRPASREDEAPRVGRVRLDGNRLDVNGSTFPLRWAGLPYWTVPPGAWGDILSRPVELGFRLLRLDIPWGLHEGAPGTYDWGKGSPGRDVPRLLRLSHRFGLFVLLNPGPWIGSSFPNGGIPPRLTTDVMCARTADGRACPFPSVASKEFAEEARRWLREVASLARDHLYPNGAVVGWIVGGVAPDGSRGGLLDHSAHASRFLARYLSVKYGEVSGSPASSPQREIDRVEAGEVASRLVLDWAEELHTGAERLPLIAEVMDHPLGAGGDVAGLRGNAGGAVLVRPSGPLDYATVRMLGLRVSGLPATAGISRLVGARALERPLGLDLAFEMAVLAMSGVRAFGLRDLTGAGELREAPLGDDGEPTMTGARIRELLRSLDAIDHPALSRRVDCLLLANRELARLREARVLDVPLPSDLGSPRVVDLLRSADAVPRPGDCPVVDHDLVFDAISDGLRAAAIPFGVADTSLPDGSLAGARVLFLVGFDRMSRALAQRLFTWVEA
ncbi:MAG: beta-galactosidase, partial [Myxococcota bacterium]